MKMKKNSIREKLITRPIAYFFDLFRINNIKYFINKGINSIKLFYKIKNTNKLKMKKVEIINYRAINHIKFIFEL